MQVDYVSLSETLLKIYVRSHLQSDALLETRNLRNLSFLTEQVDPKDVEKQTLAVKQQLLQLIKLFPRDKAGKLIAELDKLVKAIPDGAKISSIISDPEFSNDKDSQELAKKYDKSVMLATNGAASVVNAVNSLAKAIKPFAKNLSEDELKISIGELSEKAKSDADFKDKFVDASRLQAGLMKVFVPGANVKSSFERGSKAAAATAGSTQAKSGLGKLFQKATTFLGGFFTVPAAKLYPKLLEGFKEFLLTATPEDIEKLAEKMQVEGGKIITKTSQTAASASSSVTAASGGAEVSGKEDESKPKKVKSDDLEKDISGKFPGAAKAIVAALKQDEKTKDLFEGRSFEENGMPTLRFILSEAVTYEDILDVIKAADPAFTKKPEKAEQYAAKTVKFLKSNGADVDDKGAPEVKEDTEEDEEKQPEDAKDAQVASEKSAADAKVAAGKTTMGKAIHKAVIDYIQPYVDRKSLSAKARDALSNSVEKDLSSEIDKISQDLADLSSGELKGVLEKWFNGLDPNLQKKLGGPTGSKKMLQVAAKNIEDIVRTNFKVEENKRKAEGDLIVERWQRLAGIK